MHAKVKYGDLTPQGIFTNISKRSIQFTRYYIDLFTIYSKLLISIVLLSTCGLQIYKVGAFIVLYSLVAALISYVITILILWVLLNFLSIITQIHFKPKCFCHKSKIIEDEIMVPSMPMHACHYANKMNMSFNQFKVKKFNTSITEKSYCGNSIPTAYSTGSIDIVSKHNIINSLRREQNDYMKFLARQSKASIFHMNPFDQYELNQKSNKFHTITSKTKDFATAIVEFPAFQISVVLRNIGWCFIYIWFTTYMKRQKVTDSWDYSAVPVKYRIVDGAFAWVITWDFIIFLLSSSNILKFLFSLSSIVDLFTMPIAKLFAHFFFNVTIDNYLVYAGCLRFFRLIRIEDTLTHVIPWISNVRLKIISLILGTSVLILMFASLMFVIESTCNSKFSSILDYIYFAVVTISTVGYGDFTPSTLLSKFFVMLAIIVALIFLPTYIQQFLMALETPPTLIGRIPRESENYIVILGPIDIRQLVVICHEFIASNLQINFKIIIITNESVSLYKDILRVSYLKSKMKICAVQATGSTTSIHQILNKACLIIVVNRLGHSSIAEVTKDAEIDPFVIDQETYMLYTLVQQSCCPTTPVIVQLHYKTISPIVLDGAYHIICLRDLMFKLLGKSCAACPGFSTLVSNLFRTTPVYNFLNQNNFDSESSNYHLYLNGSQYGIYQVELPDCFFGVTFKVAAQYLLIKYKCYLIGFTITPQHYILNPKTLRIGDYLETAAVSCHVAIILAPSFSIIQHIMFLTTLDMTLLNHINTTYLMIENEIKFSQPKLNIPFDSANNLLLQQPDVENGLTLNLLKDKGVFRTLQLKCKSGLYIVENYETAKKFVFKNPENELLLVCGWPRGFETYLETLTRSINCNVVILTLKELTCCGSNVLEIYSDKCVWVEGSGLYTEDLLKAGVLKAKYCCIFDCNHMNGSDVSQITNCQVLIIKELIYNLYQKNVSYKSVSYSDVEDNEKVCIDMSYTSEPFVICELKSAEQTYYQSINARSNKKTLSRLRVEELWNSIGSYAYYPDYMSGRIILEETLHSMIMFSRSILRNYVDPCIIDYFIFGTLSSKASAKHENPFLALEKVSLSFYGLEFGVLYTHYMQYFDKVPIALYRPNHSHSSKFKAQDQRYFVITCPPVETEIKCGDHIYVIKLP